MQDSCYICKLGWLPDEDKPKLVCHEGLYYCEPCYNVIAKYFPFKEFVLDS